MRTICITTRKPYESANIKGALRGADRARAHFEERGIQAEFYWGIDAPRLGIVGTKPIPDSEDGAILLPRQVGTWLSHRAVWAACLLLPDEPMFLLEDDAQFPGDWKTRVEEARRRTPEDWGMLMIGSCCTWSWPKLPVSDPIYEVRWPMCLHAYIVRGHRVLEHLIDTGDKLGIAAPIDVMTLQAMRSLRVYTVLPRIVDQFDQELEP